MAAPTYLDVVEEMLMAFAAHLIRTGQAHVVESAIQDVLEASYGDMADPAQMATVVELAERLTRARHTERPS